MSDRTSPSQMGRGTARSAVEGAGEAGAGAPPLHHAAARRGPPPPAARGEDLRATLADATRRLAAVSDTPRLDAELLMAHALGATRETLLMRHLDNAPPETFASLLTRRLAQEPVAYITGARGFWSVELAVGPGALVPRPDSETLIEAAVAHFADRAPATILDLGTGPGTLLAAALAEWPDARGLGIDRSTAALAYARRNLPHAALVQGDWAAAIDARFDLVLANPPYIADAEPLPPDVARHEPAQALYAGADGLDAYRALAPQLSRLMAPAGIAAIEIGHTQAQTAGALFAAHGLAVAVRRDLGGRSRALIVQHP